MEFKIKTFRNLAVVVAVLLALCAGAWAQAGTGEVTGIVFDQSGAVIAKAAVTLTNSATGDIRKTETSAAGAYRFAALPIVGTYTLSVKTPGFGDYSATGLVVSVGATMAHDVHMQVGGSKEVVNVEANAQMIQTTESQMSQLVDNRVWQNLPLNVRGQNEFITLLAGATPDTTSTRGASVNGARGGTGNFMVEGMDNNDQGQGGRGQNGDYPGGAIVSISPDAIQEYRVITNSFAAEYGKAGGFVTDTVLKSGTNTFHGSVYEYNRVQALAANNFFSNRAGNKDQMVRNQFGFSFGGPILKDRTFFFGDTEWNRRRSAGSSHGVGTTQQFLDWVSSGNMAKWAESDPGGICVQYTGAACPGKFTNSAKLGSIFKNLQQIGPFPLAPATSCAGGKNPNCDGGGWYTSGLYYPVPAYGDVYVTNPYHMNEYRISTKFDHRLTNKDNLNVMLLVQKNDDGDPYDGGYGDIGPAYIHDGRDVNLGVTWNRTLSGTVLNTFRASYLRHRQDFPSPDPKYDRMPQIVTYDSLSVGFGLYAGSPQYFTDNQFQYQDHLSWIVGKHNFKAGGEYRRTRNGSRFFNDAAGSFWPWGVEDLVTDLYFTEEAAAAIKDTNPGSVYSATAAVDSTNGQIPDFYRGYRANEYAWYFQDDWRISQRFTLNWGVRYEYFGPPHNYKPNIDSNFYFGSPITPIATTSTNIFFPKNNPYYAKVAGGSFQIRNHEIWNKDNNNFGPRLGFAWDVLGNQKLLMKAGAGIMYDRIFNNVFENIRFNPPYFSDLTLGYAASGAVGAISTPGLYAYPFNNNANFAKGKGALPNPRHMDQDLVTPYMEQVHYGFQYDMGKGFVFEPEYVFTAGHKLIGYYDINTFNGRVAKGQPTTRVSTTISADNFRTNCCSSNYHAMQFSLRKKMSSGLGFEAHYTYSKALDYLSDLFNQRSSIAATDVERPQYDYGPADFDLKHRFTGNITWEVPFMKSNRWIGGWALNTIFYIQSGTPFTAYSSSSGYDANKDGRYTDRLVTVGGVSPLSTILGKGSPADGYLNKAAWARYTCPTSVNQGLWCNPPIGRNDLVGPGQWSDDLGISKKFKINERASVTFQGNFFNTFNHTRFAVPSGNQASSNFGKSTTAAAARQTQLALRVDF